MCSSRVRIRFFSIGKHYTPHVSSIGAATRIFRKQKGCERFVCSSGNYFLHYEILLKSGCENIFETVESWHDALKCFDTKVQINLCNKKNLRLFLSSSELNQEACNLVLSYFCLVSKTMRDCQKASADKRITALNMTPPIERLQNLFIECTAVRYYVIRNFLRS